MQYQRNQFSFVLSFVVQVSMVIVLLVGSYGVIAAQGTTTKSDTDGTTPPGMAPGAPAGSYPLSGFENVNLSNRNLNFTLPLLTVGGRGSSGLVIPLRIERKWRVQHAIVPNIVCGSGGCTTYPPTHYYYPMPNWWGGLAIGYGPGIMQARQAGKGTRAIANCTITSKWLETVTRITFSAPDGTEYDLRDQIYNGQPQPTANNCGDNSVNRGTVFVTQDGTSATFISDVAITDEEIPPSASSATLYVSGYLMLRDGTRYRVNSGLVAWKRDRNGNLTNFSYDGFNRVSVITDSLNRQITFSYGDQTLNQSDFITFSGFGGATRTIEIGHTSLNNALRSDQTIQTYQALFPTLNGSATTYQPPVVSYVKLPNNKQYTFYYDSYSELARVVLPTGGAIEYDYSGPSGGYVVSGLSDDGNLYTEKEILRYVTERRVYPDGGSGTGFVGKTVYGGDVYNNTPATVSAYVYDASNNLILKSFEKHYFLGSNVGDLFHSGTYYPQGLTGRESQSELYDSNGTTLLRKTVMSWGFRQAVSWSGAPSGQPGDDPRLTETTTTLADTNQVTKQTSINPSTSVASFDQYNNQTDVWEYDYGSGAPGALIRQTHTDYLTTNSVNGANYATDTTIHLRNLPTQQQVFDAGGTERARTTYEYDNYANDTNHAALVDRVGISGLDSGFTTSYTKRGNVTRISRFVLANTGLVGSDTEFAAYSQYDIAGNVVKAKDPKGNVAQIGYSSTYQYALPTTQTTPIPDTSGYYASSTAFTTTIAYDLSTGKVTSSTDANGQVTTAEYNDSLDRLTRIVRPTGGGETTYQYGDTVGSLYLYTQTKQDATTWIQDYALFDGLGRNWRTAHYEGPSSYSAKETKYDGLGRVSQVSNPYTIASYNAATPSGVVWTTSAYDALSRATTVTTPDNAFVTTSYSGNAVTLEDQHDPLDPDTTKRVGRKRTSYTDAIGRLSQVTEDPGGLSYQTYYSYDVLGNLVKVNQGAQNRYFLYDSLSRLARVRNVEQDVNSALTTTATGTYSGLGNTQWTMAYTYDANGNPYQRQEARNNGSSVPITATYGYDALNRNITLSYNDGITPVIERHYDSATNGKGRLYYDLSYNQHPASNIAAYSYTQINGYDAVGRVTSQTQNLLNASGAWVPYTVSRTYDLASHVLTQTYPSGRTITNSFAASGRLNNFSGNLGDGVTRTYADTLTYNSAGLMTKERFGATTSLYHNIHYNSRYQPVDIRLGTSSTDEWTWNRGALIAYYSNQARSAGNAFLDAKDNYGSVAMQEHYVPTDDAISSYSEPLRDTYEYDRLNRLTQTNGLQRSTSGAWTADYAQWYNYDQYGNRTINNGSTWGTGINNLVCTISTTNNRINGVTYDAAGNVTSDPNGVSTATYDSENRVRNVLKSGSWSYYVYDADGKRVRRIVGSETWHVYGMEGELVAEYPSNGAAASPQKEYGYRSSQMLVVGGCDVVRWVVADHLGTPRIEADSTGSLSGIRRHDYLPFGEELSVGMGNGSIRTTAMGYPPPVDCVRQKFAGYERDVETGLDFAQARYYANVQGRFTSVDPLNPILEYSSASEKAFKQYLNHPQNWNRFVYVSNHPLTQIDPDGRGWKRVDSPYSEDRSSFHYEWVDDPNVHDIPFGENFRYIDDKGRVVLLQSSVDGSWHSWAIEEAVTSDKWEDHLKDVHTNDHSATPRGYKLYMHVKLALEIAGYKRHWDPLHPGANNFWKDGSPTLNISVYTYNLPFRESMDGYEVTSIEAHREKHNPHSEMRKHITKEVIPHYWEELKDWASSLLNKKN